MGYDLQQFSAECHRILAVDPGVAGRQKVCALLQQVLKDDGFVAAQLRAETPEREIVYEDKELGFCILAHSYQGAKESAPHDHGPSWALYGQARVGPRLKRGRANRRSGISPPPQWPAKSLEATITRPSLPASFSRRAARLTAGPMQVKSSRSPPPILPWSTVPRWSARPKRR